MARMRGGKRKRGQVRSGAPDPALTPSAGMAAIAGLCDRHGRDRGPLDGISDEAWTDAIGLDGAHVAVAAYCPGLVAGENLAADPPGPPGSRPSVSRRAVPAAPHPAPRPARPADRPGWPALTRSTGTASS